MGAKPSYSQQIDLGMFVRSRLWADVIELLADMVCERRICHLGCALRPSQYSPDAHGPVCHEIRGCRQLLPRRIARAATYMRHANTYLIDMWIFRHGRYRVVPI